MVPLLCHRILRWIKGIRKRVRGPNPAYFLCITGKVDLCRGHLYLDLGKLESRIKTSETYNWKSAKSSNWLPTDFYIKWYKKESSSLGSRHLTSDMSILEDRLPWFILYIGKKLLKSRHLHPKKEKVPLACQRIPTWKGIRRKFRGINSCWFS